MSTDPLVDFWLQFTKLSLSLAAGVSYRIRAIELEVNIRPP